MQDALKRFNRSSFDVSKLLHITFLGESAVDTGGPRREFFRLLLIELFSASNLFEGYPSAVTPTHNVLALSNGCYRTAGLMIATSIIQGGPAPHCFATLVADILVYGKVQSDANMSEIINVEIREKMEKASDVCKCCVLVVTDFLLL